MELGAAALSTALGNTTLDSVHETVIWCATVLGTALGIALANELGFELGDKFWCAARVKTRNRTESSTRRKNLA